MNICTYMYMPIYMYIYVYVYIRVYIYIYIYICIYIYVYICVHTYVYIYIYTYMYMYVYTNIYIRLCIYIGIYTYICISIHIPIYMYEYIYLYVYAHIYAYIYVHIYIYIHMHLCIHIHTSMYMYVHICIYTQLLQIENREQTQIELLRIDPISGETTTLFVEDNKEWLNLHNMLTPLVHILSHTHINTLPLSHSFSLYIYVLSIYMHISMNVSQKIMKSGSIRIIRYRWRRCIGCLKLQVPFRTRAANSMSLLQKETYKDKASYVSSPSCNPPDTHSLSPSFCVYTHQVYICTFIYIYIS